MVFHIVTSHFKFLNIKKVKHKEIKYEKLLFSCLVQGKITLFIETFINLKTCSTKELREWTCTILYAISKKEMNRVYITVLRI